MAALHIQTLGSFQLMRGEVPLDNRAWVTHKAQTLFKILLTRRQRVTTQEQLIEWLYPEAEPAGAAKSLRTLVSRVRRALEPDLPRYARSRYLIVAQGQYALQLDSADFLDTLAFESAFSQAIALEKAGELEAARQAYRRANDLYGGRYLPEERYADWVSAERERLSRLHIDLLLRQAEIEARHGFYRAAVALIRELLAHDSLHEKAWRALMRYHYFGGDVGSALQAYERCRQLLEDQLATEPAGETTRLAQSIREQRLEGYPQPHIVERLTGRRNLSAATDSAETQLSLPNPLTPLIGRESNIEDVVKQLLNPACRLLTITGQGGSGKTRLAIASARALHRSDPYAFADGISFIACASIRDTARLPLVIGESIGYAFAGSRPPLQQLQQYLRDKSLLLVLDNFEHLLASAEITLALLSSAASVKLLVTSRESLLLHGEWRYPLDGLPLDCQDESPAVQLFLQTAARIRHNIRFDADALASIVEICRLVEGIPLAIELAATWIGVYTVAEIASRIAESYTFLAAQLGGMPSRHQSIERVYGDSWALLSPAEQVILPALALFHSGFDRAAAQAVANAAPQQIAQLEAKQWIRAGAQGKWTMHQMLAQFVSAKQPPNEATTARFTAYFADMLASMLPRIRSADQLATINAISDAAEDIYAAWDASLAQQSWTHIGRMAQTLFLFHEIRNRFIEGEHLFKRAVEAIDSAETPAPIALQSTLKAHLAWFHYRLGLVPSALRLSEEAVAILPPAPATPSLAQSTWIRAVTMMSAGQAVQAIPLLWRAHSMLVELGDAWSQAFCLFVIGMCSYDAGFIDKAQALFDEALAISERVGDGRLRGHLLIRLSRVYNIRGDYEAAQTAAAAGKVLMELYRDRLAASYGLDVLGQVYENQGAYQQALTCYSQVLALRQRIQHRAGVARALARIGVVACKSADYDTARDCFVEALTIMQQQMITPIALQTLAGSTLWLQQMSDQAFAAQLVDYVRQHPSTWSETHREIDAIHPQANDDANRLEATIGDVVALLLTKLTHAA